MALFVFLVSVIMFILFVYRLYPWLRYKLPPGPYPWPIVGNLLDVKPDRCRCFAEWSKVYGPIMSVWIGSSLNVIVSSSELAKEVLKDNDHRLANRQRRRAEAIDSRGVTDLIWADYGSHYTKLRKVCTLELFSPKSIEALRPIREDEVKAMIASIYKDSTNPDSIGKSLVLRKYLGSVAFNNITRLVFGKRFESSKGVLDAQGLEFRAIVANEFKLGIPLGIVEHISWLRWVLLLSNDEAYTKHLARKDQLTQAIMEEHRAKGVKSGVMKQHFVDALLSLREKYELTEDTVKGLLWNMITAGMDTVAIIVEWAMAELVKNPRVQQKAQEELDRVIGANQLMNESDMLNLPYLQCVAKESLRLHPPTPLMLPHRANAHVKIGGFDIPKETIVFVNVWDIARDQSKWDHPLEFKPERFLQEDVDIKGHDFRLLPFGAGRRMCPAAQLSFNLVTLMLGQLLHHFKWTPAPAVLPEEIDMSDSPGLVDYMGSPLQVVPTPRLPEQVYQRLKY